MEKVPSHNFSDQEYALVVDVFGEKSRHQLSSSDVERDERIDVNVLNKLIKDKVVTISKSKLSHLYLLTECEDNRDRYGLVVAPTYLYYFLSPEASRFVYEEKKTKEAS